MSVAEADSRSSMQTYKKIRLYELRADHLSHRYGALISDGINN
jgi:hypothetical protein